MAAVVTAALLAVVAIALTVWFMLGRDEFGSDTGAANDNQNWAPPGMQPFSASSCPERFDSEAKHICIFGELA